MVQLHADIQPIRNRSEISLADLKFEHFIITMNEHKMCHCLAGTNLTLLNLQHNTCRYFYVFPNYLYLKKCKF